MSTLSLSIDQTLLHPIEIPQLTSTSHNVDKQHNSSSLLQSINQSLTQLLSLPHIEFCAHILYNTSFRSFVTSFLEYSRSILKKQRTNNKSDSIAPNQALTNTSHSFLRILVRLTNNAQAPHLDIITNVFTISDLIDISAIYGKSNTKIVENIIKRAFEHKTFQQQWENMLNQLNTYLTNITNKFIRVSTVNISDLKITIALFDDVIDGLTNICLLNQQLFISISHHIDFVCSLSNIFDIVLPLLEFHYSQLINADDDNDDVDGDEDDEQQHEHTHRLLQNMTRQMLSLIFHSFHYGYMREFDHPNDNNNNNSDSFEDVCDHFVQLITTRT